MIMVQIRYDNGQLQVLNPDANVQIENGDVYTLAVFDTESGPETDWIDFRSSVVLEA